MSLSLFLDLCTHLAPANTHTHTHPALGFSEHLFQVICLKLRASLDFTLNKSQNRRMLICKLNSFHGQFCLKVRYKAENFTIHQVIYT